MLFNSITCRLYRLTGTCSEGYTGVLCGVCSTSYYLSGGRCARCVGESKLVLPLLLVGLVAVGLAFIFVSRRYNLDHGLMVFKILLGFSQVYSCSVYI